MNDLAAISTFGYWTGLAESFQDEMVSISTFGWFPQNPHIVGIPFETIKLYSYVQDNLIFKSYIEMQILFKSRLR